MAVTIDRIITKKFGLTSEAPVDYELTVGPGTPATEWPALVPGESQLATVRCSGWSALVTNGRLILSAGGGAKKIGWWCALASVSTPVKESRTGEMRDMAVIPVAAFQFGNEEFRLETTVKEVGALYGLSGLGTWIHLQLKTRHANLSEVGLLHSPTCPLSEPQS